MTRADWQDDVDPMALAFTDITAPPAVDRRDFLKLLGGGIVIFVALGDLLFAQDPERRGRRRGGGGRGGPTDFNAFLRIGEDGKVTCFAGKVEMGQGIWTSLPQMLAEELDAPLESIQIVLGDTDLCPWDMGTFGSMTTRFFGPSLRAAGAEARAVLIELAAAELGVPAERLDARDGAVFDKSDDTKRVTFGALAKGQKIQRTVGREAVLKSIAAHRVIGKPVVSSDAVDKVKGRALFTGDVRLPGMLYARIVRPPAHDATRRSLDTSEAERIDGVRVVQDGDLCAVLAPTPDGAEEALRLITADWDVPTSELDESTIFAHLVKVAPAPNVLAEEGDVERGEKRAASVVESTFEASYIAHAPMENHTAVAQIKGGKVTVWASTQTPFPARDQIARTLGLRPENVRVIAPFVGGGFGGKGHNPQVVEAARLAKAAGVPVHLEWTREEEFFYDSFRPAAVVKVRSGVGQDGKLVSWDYGVYAAGTRGAQQFYAVPDHHTVSYGRGWQASAPGTHPFNTGAWRAPACSTNCFARESQIDIMAAKAGVDPLEFRLSNLRDQRMRKVLQAAADAFGWQPAKGPSRRGFGIACGIDAGTYVAHMAKVAVDPKTGQVRVERVVCAQDMGLVINPRGAKMQMEGCITMGLGYALGEEIRFLGGAVRTGNFHEYDVPRFSWVPAIETVLVDTGIEEAHGGGEPAIIGMGAVVANAIFDATGARLYRMPMTPARVKAALG